MITQLIRGKSLSLLNYLIAVLSCYSLLIISLNGVDNTCLACFIG